MKKAISLILALLLCVSIAVPALAADSTADTVSIYWLKDKMKNMPSYYYDELNWIKLGTTWVDLSTGKAVDFGDAYDNVYIWPFSDDLAVIVKSLRGSPDYKYGFIDKTGKEVIPARYAQARSFSEGLARVSEDGKKFGYINTSGTLVIPMIYEDDNFSTSISYDPDFHEGMAMIYRDNKYGFIDKTGKEVIAPQYQDAYAFSEGLALVKSNNKYGFIDKAGNVVIPLEYEDAYSFCEGLAAVVKDGKLGAIDRTGKVVLPLEYDNNWDDLYFHDGLAAVSKDGKWGFVDKSGNVVIPLEYDGMAFHSYMFSEGLAAVVKDGKCGYIDTTGKVVIPLQYTAASKFSEGRGSVVDSEGTKFIDATGKVIFAMDGHYGLPMTLERFSNGLAVASVAYIEGVQGGSGYINRDGDIIVPLDYFVGMRDYGYIMDGTAPLAFMNHVPLIRYVVVATKDQENFGIVENPYYAEIHGLAPSTPNFGEFLDHVELVSGTPSKPDGITVTVGGKAVTWTDAAPFIDKNNRTMVPLRAVADAMGLTVDWDGKAREAVFSNGSKTIYFPIGSTTARTGDGKNIQMDTAAVIVKDRTYAPIRYLAEYFGYTVGWDGETKTVSLK